MPIYAADNRLMLSEDMSQEDTGGGRMSGVEAPNGQVSAVFAKLARLTFLGKWRAAKVFFGVFTRSQDTAAEAHTVLLRGPTDPLLEVLLFRTGSHTDRLPAAKEYVANYLVPGGDAQMYLYSTVAAGQDVAQWWQRLDQLLPRAGDVFRLSTVLVSEDVKLTSIAIQELTLYDPEGRPYVRRLLTCRLFAALRNGYTGVSIGQFDPAADGLATRTRLMLTNSSVRYYGAKPLAADAVSGAQSLDVTTIYGQLVPAVYAPAALTNRPAVATGQQTVLSNQQPFTVTGPTHARAIPIVLANQDSVYVVPLAPAPATGTGVAHVRILQTWYTVYEDGSRNQPGQTLQVANGVATLALGAGFPDLDSLVIFQWSSGIHFADRSGLVVLRPITFRVTLPELPESGSVGVAWISNTISRSVTEGSDMVLSGDGSGFRVGLEIALQVGNLLPDAGTSFTVTYQALATVTEIITPTLAGHTATFTLGDPPRPGSVRVTWTVEQDASTRYKQQVQTPVRRKSARAVHTCNSGNCWDDYQSEITYSIDTSSSEESSQITQSLTRTAQDDKAGHIGGGTIVYETGVVAMPVTKDYASKTFDSTTVTDDFGTYETGEWTEQSSAEVLDGPLTVIYALAPTLPGAVETLTVAVPPLEIALLPQYQDDLIPGTWRIRLGSVEYRDGGDGVLYLIDGTTVAGSIDYANRTALVTRWTGATSVVVIHTGISAFGMPGTTRIIGRTDGDPLSVGQWFIRATGVDGTAITGSGQSDQTITGTGIAAGSTIRWDSGAFETVFTDPVYPGAVYDCVVQEVMPLSEAQIGIDATRLPRDGRVPLYRQSDAVLVHQTAADDCPTGLTAGQVIDTGVTNLAELYLVDEGGDEQTETLPTGLTAGFSFQALSTAPVGQRVCEYLLLKDSAGRHVSGDLFSADLATGLISGATPLSLEGYLQPLIARYVRRVGQSLYSVDLAAGTVTMASPLDLTSYTQPLGRRSRWEDWSRLRKNPVGNTLLLQDEINHDYDAGEALVSGIVEHGDLRARVSTVFFGQATWTAVWSDVVIGTPVSLYDSSNYPPGITNDGAITARMALVFTSSTGFTLWIEDRGAVATGTKSADFAPINPATGYPYLTLYSAGWSVSTATGNALRLNTVAAAAPYWVSLCVSAGDPTMADDGFLLANRTDAD